jgi:hypothetical protein
MRCVGLRDLLLIENNPLHFEANLTLQPLLTYLSTDGLVLA